MAHYQNTPSSTGSLFEIAYDGITAEELAKTIDNIFKTDGYSTKMGDLGNRTYVKGNRVTRILFGAFSKYFEFHVGITELGENHVNATVRKTSTGMSGGVIGVNQVKNELKRIEQKMVLL
jgi:hypothetical protein